MVGLPEIKQTVYASLVEGFAKLAFLSDEEIEEVAHSLERASGVADLHDFRSFKQLADIVRSYKGR